jgi:hypothetical protein
MPRLPIISMRSVSPSHRVELLYEFYLSLLSQ